MVNVFDTISLKNMQIVILLLQLYYDSIRKYTQPVCLLHFIWFLQNCLLGTFKKWSMFSTQFHSKICKSWYYCCNCITTQSGTRHNRFASFILYDSSRTVYYEHLKKWSMFSTQFHSKICKSWYYCCNCITTQSGTRHNRFASFILYDSSRTVY